MREFQLIKINADTPYVRGIQYGEQARERILKGLEDYKILFAETSTMDWDTIKNYAKSYIPLVEKTFPDIMYEIKGIGEGAKVGIDEIMLLNCRYEITKFPKPNECTSFAVLPEASENNKTYVGQNWDYRAGILNNIVMLHITETNGMRIFGLAEAGQVIRNGFNSNGVGLCANNLQSIYDNRELGIPVTILRRKVLSCSCFDEAKDIIVKAQRSVSCNFMLASAKGKALDFETYPNGVDYIEPVDGIVTHGNHFVVDPKKDALKKTPRGERLEELLREKQKNINVEHIKKCLSDHANYPDALCCHPSDVSKCLGRRGITVAGIIYDFDEKTAYISAGPPCENEFIPYKL